jgi:hypothetical protein
MDTAYGKSHQSAAALISPKHASTKEFAGFPVLDLSSRADSLGAPVMTAKLVERSA